MSVISFEASCLCDSDDRIAILTSRSRLLQVDFNFSPDIPLLC